MRILFFASAAIITNICAASLPAKKLPEEIPYRVIEQRRIPNGGWIRLIVIDPKHRNEKDLRLLGERLKLDTAGDRHATITIYDDERAARLLQKVILEENTEDSRFHDEHQIGFYDRNVVTGYHALKIFLKGSKGPKIEVRYRAPRRRNQRAPLK